MTEKATIAGRSLPLAFSGVACDRTSKRAREPNDHRARKGRRWGTPTPLQSSSLRQRDEQGDQSHRIIDSSTRRVNRIRKLEPVFPISCGV